jgi:hypothetical protein
VLLLVGQLFSDRLPLADTIFSVGLSLILSVALAVADWRIAAFLKTEAAQIRQSLPADSSVWFTGHWEWQWYATKAGFHQVDVKRPHLVSGDFLIIPEDVRPQPIVDAPQMDLVRRDSKPLTIWDLFCTGRSGPLDPDGTRATFGFYLFFWRYSPWILTKSCTTNLDIYRVR